MGGVADMNGGADKGFAGSFIEDLTGDRGIVLLGGGEKISVN
jgi:hypothetical protein